MALRMIELILPEKKAENLSELLKERPIIERRQVKLPDEQFLVRIILDSEDSEEILDLLADHYASDTSRLVMLPVQAVVPVEESNKEAYKKSPERIGREELYENIKDNARFTRVYLTMIVLSAIVAVIGMQRANIPMIIGAMVIAPLLGPNMAIALGTTLGDIRLLRRAMFTAAIGYAVAILFSAALGFVIHQYEPFNEAMFRSQAGAGDILVALASGSAGALAFSSGMSAILIGVMVAVSLLPPLVSIGILLGSGHLSNALGALSLFLINLICINLSAILTFVVQGIHPAAWWEKERAGKATKIAILLWAALLAALICMILFW